MEDHPETLLTSNPLLVNRSGTLPSVEERNNEGYSESALGTSVSEPSQKVEKLKRCLLG
jgi:hypothetical protein